MAIVHAKVRKLKSEEREGPKRSEGFFARMQQFVSVLSENCFTSQSRSFSSFAFPLFPPRS